MNRRFGFLFLTVLLMGSVATAALAQTPTTYQVQSGDSLWTIAEQFYGDGARWTEIAAMNGIDVSNPPFLRVGEILTVSLDERKALVRRYIEEIWNRGDLDVVDELFTLDYTIHTLGQTFPTSYEALKQGVAGARTTFPDIQMTLTHIIADGDKVAAYWTTVGTHLGEFRLPDMPEGIPPTGRPVEFTEVVTFRIADGRIAEAWYVADQLTMMQQLGLGPSSEQGEAVQEEGSTSPEEVHKALFQRFAEEAWNQGKLDIVDELFAPEYIAHAANAEQEVHGPEGHKEFIVKFREAFPDVHLTFNDLLAEDDMLVARMTWEGTHTGEYLGIPPTGNRIAVDVTGINRFVGDQVVEAWGVVDMLSMLQQLGVIPSPEQEDDR
ncbi:MAG: ester cyclase [Candidatus Bipolaricaulia bacterium]